MSQNRVIGKSNRLPWRLPDELQYFRDTVRGRPIIMGRKTFEGVGKPIKGCLNIVLSRSRATFSGCIHASSLEDALQCAVSTKEAKRNNEVFVIGGSGVYTETLPLAHRLYRTVVETDIEGDTYFPAYDESQWTLSSCAYHDVDSRHPFSFRMEIFDRTPHNQ